MRCYRHPGLDLLETHDNLPLWLPEESYDAFQATQGKLFYLTSILVDGAWSQALWFIKRKYFGLSDMLA